MSATSNPTVKAVPTASTASKDLPFVGQVFFLTGREKESEATEGCGMKTGRLRPTLSLKTPTETFGCNPSSRNGSATTIAAQLLSFTTPQQPYFAQRLPNPAPYNGLSRAAFLEFRTYNRPYVGRPLSNFVPCSSRGTLLYAVIFCLQASPSAATSLVGPLGRTLFSPPPLCLAIRIRQTKKRGRRNKCTGLFTKRDAVN